MLMVSCSTTNDQEINNVMPTSDFDGVSAPATLFINRGANEHHQAMRDLASNWPTLERLALNHTPAEQIYQEMLGNNYDLWLNIHSNVNREFITTSLDNNAKVLCKMMDRFAETRELLAYMDDHNCRTEFNEVLVSSYIVFTQEDTNIDMPMDGIDWTGVGVMDALGLAVSPAGAVAVSSGCVVGYGLRMFFN